MLSANNVDAVTGPRRSNHYISLSILVVPIPIGTQRRLQSINVYGPQMEGEAMLAEDDNVPTSVSLGPLGTVSGQCLIRGAGP